MPLCNEHVIKYFRWEYFKAKTTNRLLAMTFLAEWINQEMEAQREPTATCSGESSPVRDTADRALPGQNHDSDRRDRTGGRKKRITLGRSSWGRIWSDVTGSWVEQEHVLCDDSGPSSTKVWDD